jgi:hypothetical protein
VDSWPMATAVIQTHSGVRPCTGIRLVRDRRRVASSRGRHATVGSRLSWRTPSCGGSGLGEVQWGQLDGRRPIPRAHAPGEVEAGDACRPPSC